MNNFDPDTMNTRLPWYPTPLEEMPVDKARELFKSYAAVGYELVRPPADHPEEITVDNDGFFYDRFIPGIIWFCFVAIMVIATTLIWMIIL